jgi:hypothetical protein
MVLENDLVSFEVIEGILYGRYKVTEINLETAKLATSFRKQITEGNPMPAIADISMVKLVPKDTREYFSSAQAGEDISAMAVIINNPVARTIGNFFLKFHQPKYPFRFFTSVDEATNWIKQFV